MHPLIAKYMAGELPEPMAQTLVSGALPLPPIELLQALAYAVFSERPEAIKAHETVMELPESLLSSVILERMESPDVLGLILLSRREPALLESLLLHPDMTAEWMERVVPSLPGPLLEIALNNQVFWLERPNILTLLEKHPEADTQVKRRIEEFRRDVLGQMPPEAILDRIDILKDVKAGKLDKAWEDLPVPKMDEQDSEAGVESELEKAHRTDSPILDEEGKEISLTLTQRMMRLRTNQKVLLAQKGGKEERTLLIRESNRLIQVAVIRNPRITESEVAYIAQMRSVHDEVLRIISMNREWMKKYGIVKNLVLNPRTQLSISLNLLKRINEFDMKLIVKDRNIAELLRREAKRIINQKGAERGSGG